MKKYLFVLVLFLISFGLRAEFKESKAGNSVYLFDVTDQRTIFFNKIISDVYLQISHKERIFTNKDFVEIELVNEKNKKIKLFAVLGDEGDSITTLIQNEDKKFFYDSKNIKLNINDSEKKKHTFSFDTNGIDFKKLK